MPIQWKAKAAGEVIQREWDVPVYDGDSVTSFTASIDGATLDSSDRSGDKITFTISAGTNGATAIATLTASTINGLTYNETAYLPIRQTPNDFSYNVGQVLSYALRPIVGLGAVATAEEQEDARENLDDMLAEWANSGADMGVKLPTASSDTLYVSDSFISAIKNSLRVRVCGLYGKPVDQTTYMAAMRGAQQIKAALLPDKRKAEYF